MGVKLKLIAAACENMGIGKDNNLPWRLKSEMAYFTKMTSETVDLNKKNVVIMGRRTWESIPKKYKPLPGRVNFVLSRNNVDLSSYEDCYSFKSLDEAISRLNSKEFGERIEQIWVIGGSHVYSESLNHPNFYQLFLTRIKQNYECDTFFPELPKSLVDVTKELRLENIPKGEQEEDGVKFEYKVYENSNYAP